MAPSGLPARKPLLPNGVLGMLVFVLTECMLFAGLVSAFSIVRASADVWPPVGQPRLPVEVTALNTLVLLVSGVALVVAARRLSASSERVGAPLYTAIALGGTFVLVQGAEWVALIGEGLTLTAGQLGGFFYLIVGCHALHAVGALAGLLWVARRHRAGELTRDQLQTVAILWGFVVIVWPFLYVEVYL